MSYSLANNRLNWQLYTPIDSFKRFGSNNCKIPSIDPVDILAIPIQQRDPTNHCTRARDRTKEHPDRQVDGVEETVDCLGLWEKGNKNSQKNWLKGNTGSEEKDGDDGNKKRKKGMD